MRHFFITFIAMILVVVPTMAQKGNTSKTLVAYFSATGTTRHAAEKLAKEKQAVLWEIEAMEPYTAADLDWRNKQSRSSLEMKDEEARPAIKQCTNLMPYDTIYVGYPIWWGICPRIINSWIDNNLEQLKGKTLVPFATSGGSDVHESVEYLRKTYPALHWEKGMLMK
ncbi:MAG: NAD(P)H-dependent oxidoreductase [Paludibacteraceae bacterium]|nr:NAD(P)H-dependent oxidoreductase [Paludibacteraceae bacterium]